MSGMKCAGVGTADFGTNLPEDASEAEVLAVSGARKQNTSKQR